ncbi:MAG TPA: glycosyltransferase [Candidatus Angelobacter sp.]|nr:glycosyltransferase [Candidatus Angelobacter sp.]
MNMTRRRVLFIFPFPSLGGGGGAQRVPSTLLRHLDHQQYEFHLALLQAKRGEGDDIPPGVAVHSLEYSRVRYGLLGLVRLIHKVKPDVVFSNICHMNLALLLVRPLFPRNTRVLIGESTTLSAYLQQATRRPKIWSALYRWLYKRADKITCLSDAIKNDLAAQFSVPLEKLIRIYNPMDWEMVRASSQLGGNPFAGEGPNLVAAGRFVREKGIDLLLGAMPGVVASFPQARLTLLGEGPLEEELKEQARKLGVQESVIFAGLQQNPWRYFRHANLVVVPSRLDGMPYVAVEALAVGTPIVATDCPGGIRELTDESKWIVLVPPEDPKALAEAIVSRLKEPKSNLEPSVQLSKFELQEAVNEYDSLLGPGLALVN